MFFCFLPQFFAISFKKYPVLEVPIRIGDQPFRLATCPLGRREPQHCTFFFGFTGSPRTSLFKFNVSFCLLRRFYYLVQVNLLFPCVLHLAFSLVPGCISSVYILHISCCLLPTCIGSFHVFFHLSNVPLFKLHLLFLFFLHLQCLPLFNLHFAFPFFLQLSCVPLSDLHVPNPFLFALFLHLFKM